MHSFLYLSIVILSATAFGRPAKCGLVRRADPKASQRALYSSLSSTVTNIKEAMLSSIRTSWEQGTAAGAILELEDNEYSVFAESPFEDKDKIPVSTLHLALSAAVRQTADGRLSQQINDALDGAALDGASAGSSVLLGTYTESSRRAYWQKAADAQLNFLLNTAPRTSTGAISHRVASAQYWADGVYMGFPFIAAYGSVTNNQTMLQIAYDNCRLYRDALLLDGPTGKLWAHIYNDDTKTFNDSGLWATGNAWAALGMQRVQVTIMKSSFAGSMKDETQNLSAWVKEILDGTFAARNSNNLIPDYISGGPKFGDASSTGALASVAYRAAVLDPETFGSNYTDIAGDLRKAVLSGVDDLGVISPLVDPLNFGSIGILSTEGQAFALMMIAAWKAWLDS